MLPRKYRINKSKDYNLIYKKARRYVSRYFILFVKENNGEFNRYGIVASKRIGKAVRRNKIKRQIRAIIMKEGSNLKQGLDLVIVCRTPINKAGYYEIYKDLKKIFQKAKIC